MPGREILRRVFRALEPKFVSSVPRIQILFTSSHEATLTYGAVQELRGKRVSVGAARSGNELNARALLSAADMSYADLLQVEYLEYGVSVDLMAKEQLDAAIISAGLGVAAVNRAASQMPIILVPVQS